MYSLTICFGPTGSTWQFLFKDKERAEATYKMVQAGIDVHIADDFGTSAYVNGSVRGVLLADLDNTEEAAIQRALADARAKVRYDKRAQDDAVLRVGQRGPAVLTPMGGFRGN